MCSIMGFEKKDVTREELQPFFARTKSRGPDMSRVVETPTGWLYQSVLGTGGPCSLRPSMVITE